MKSEALKHAMYYGLLIGIVLIIRFLCGLLNPTLSGLGNIVTMVLLVWMTFKFSSNCRDQIFDGMWSYGKALWYIIQLAFYGSMVSAVFVLVYTSLVPSFFEGITDLIATSLESLEESGVYSETMVDELQKTMDTMFTPRSYSAITLIANLFNGFFTGLIVAAIVKNDNPFASTTPNDNNE
ncbi:MAG: DUF4199 domain-containing protein [Bacteroidales bacterium]|nr:DUF4199 domain-containing protein [Bacteroidales bacterium]